MLLAEVSLVNTVDLRKFDVLLLERRRGLLILRGQVLTVPTPGEEKNE